MKIRILVLVLTVLFTWGHSNYAFASQQPMMSLEELESLLEASLSKTVAAYFESIPRGTALKQYDIVIRGVLEEPGLKIILFVTSHKIVAGMSGSPVYVEVLVSGIVHHSCS